MANGNDFGAWIDLNKHRNQQRQPSIAVLLRVWRVSWHTIDWRWSSHLPPEFLHRTIKTMLSVSVHRRWASSEQAARLHRCSWLERSLPGTVTHPSHVQMFNPLAPKEAGGNATLSTPARTLFSVGGGTHWSPFLLMRFVRGEKCCISVFCVASRVPQNHPVVGKILSEASVPSCSQLLPSVTAPRRLSFSSSRPEKNLSIAAVDVSADPSSSSSSSLLTQLKMGWLHPSVILLLPRCLSAALWRKL